MRHKFGIKEVDECHISSVITGYNEAGVSIGCPSPSKG